MKYIFPLMYTLIFLPICVQGMDTVQDTQPMEIYIIPVYKQPIICALRPENRHCSYSLLLSDAIQKTETTSYGPIGSKDLRPIEHAVLEHNPCQKDHTNRHRWTTKALISTGVGAGMAGVAAGLYLATILTKPASGVANTK